MVLMLSAEEGEVVLVSWVKELLRQAGTVSDHPMVDATSNVEVELATFEVAGEAGHTWLLGLAEVAELPEAVLPNLSLLLRVLRAYQPGESISIVTYS